MEEEKRRKWKKYFMYQVPIMIVVTLCWIFIPNGNPDKERLSYEGLFVGKYVLYDYATGEEIGSFEILKIAGDCMEINLFGKQVSGIDPILKNEYHFDKISLEKFPLEMRGGHEKYWLGTYLGTNVVLIKILFNDLKIPMDELDNHDYYLVSVISDDTYKRIEEYTDTNLSLRRFLNSNASRRIYSGLVLTRSVNLL